MKKLRSFLMITFTALMLLQLCACAAPAEQAADDGRFHIVASSFPAFDFARQIAGERCRVTLLVPPGSESHSYEPTARDIITLQSCDLLVCNGGVGESWIETLLSGSETEIPTFYMLDCVELVAEEHIEGMQNVAHEHVHDESCEHEDEAEESHEEHGHEEHGHEEHGHEGHGHEGHGHEGHGHEEHEEFDEHVWTSPVNAMAICSALCERLCALDGAGEELYKENLSAYLSELEMLHESFLAAVAEGRRDTLIFADRFPVRYFVEEYGLEYYAAFPGCAEEAEPSARTVAFLIDRVRENEIPAVFYIEFSNEKMADVIVEDTGCKKLLFHSCHTVSAEDIENGVTYIELMKINLANLKEALD